MRKYLFIILIALFFVGCKANSDLPETTETTESSENRDTTSNQTENQTKSYPKLKIENKRANDYIYTVELANYIIEPLMIAPNESATFELINGMLYYDNVTIAISYGVSRGTGNVHITYFRKNFADGQTTTVTLE